MLLLDLKCCGLCQIVIFSSFFFPVQRLNVNLRQEYVNKFFHGETSSEEQRRTGFIWTHGLCSRVR